VGATWAAGSAWPAGRVPGTVWVVGTWVGEGLVPCWSAVGSGAGFTAGLSAVDVVPLVVLVVPLVVLVSGVPEGSEGAGLLSAWSGDCRRPAAGSAQQGGGRGVSSMLARSGPLPAQVRSGWSPRPWHVSYSRNCLSAQP